MSDVYRHDDHWFCRVCDARVDGGERNWEEHQRGNKHQAALLRSNDRSARRQLQRSADYEPHYNDEYCELCRMEIAPGKKNWEEHLIGRRHKRIVAELKESKAAASHRSERANEYIQDRETRSQERNGKDGSQPVPELAKASDRRADSHENSTASKDRDHRASSVVETLLQTVGKSAVAKDVSVLPTRDATNIEASLIAKVTGASAASKEPKYHCEICDLDVDGYSNWQLHLSGRRHSNAKVQSKSQTPKPERIVTPPPPPQPAAPATTTQRVVQPPPTNGVDLRTFAEKLRPLSAAAVPTPTTASDIERKLLETLHTPQSQSSPPGPRQPSNPSESLHNRILNSQEPAKPAAPPVVVAAPPKSAPVEPEPQPTRATIDSPTDSPAHQTPPPELLSVTVRKTVPRDVASVFLNNSTYIIRFPECFEAADLCEDESEHAANSDEVVLCISAASEALAAQAERALEVMIVFSEWSLKMPRLLHSELSHTI